MKKFTITIRVNEALKIEFTKAAKAAGSSGAELLRSFMKKYIEEQKAALQHDWFRRQVLIGRVSADAGNLIPAAEVEAKFAAKRAATRRRLQAGR